MVLSAAVVYNWFSLHCYATSSPLNNASIIIIFVAVQDTMDGNCTDGEIRLVRGGLVTEFEGRVEVCVNNAWGTISSRNFDALEVRVICSQKGFSDLAGS